MWKVTVAAIAGLTLLAAAASAQNVSVDYDRTANFAQYKTYAWARGTELADPLNHSRVVRAVDSALAAKGLRPAGPDADADMLVAYHASFDTNLQISGSAYGMGPFGIGGDRWGTATVERVQVGTLVVDLTDARTHALVWRGMASSDVNPGDSAAAREKKINKATAKLFRNFPPAPR